MLTHLMPQVLTQIFAIIDAPEVPSEPEPLSPQTSWYSHNPIYLMFGSSSTHPPHPADGRVPPRGVHGAGFAAVGCLWQRRQPRRRQRGGPLHSAPVRLAARWHRPARGPHVRCGNQSVRNQIQYKINHFGASIEPFLCLIVFPFHPSQRPGELGGERQREAGGRALQDAAALAEGHRAAAGLRLPIAQAAAAARRQRARTGRLCVRDPATT